MFVVKIFSVGLLLLVASIVPSQAEITAQQKHQEWISGIVDSGEDIRYRALTGHTEGSAYIVLAFDRAPQNCLLQHVAINVILSNPTNSKYDSKQHFGALRIDEAVTHNITYTIGEAIGTPIANRAAIITLQNFDKEATILEELRRGRNIRFKLDDDFYLRFSLSGFTNASARSLQLCTGYNNENSDKNYFGDNTRVKDDKNYFKY